MTYPESIERFEKKIGFDPVRAEISRLCSSDPGRAAAARLLVFTDDYNTVMTTLREVTEMREAISGDNGLVIGRVADLSAILARVRAAGTFLSPDELLALNATLNTATTISDFFAARRGDDGASLFPCLDSTVRAFGSFGDIASLINRTIDRFGEVRDNASAELAEIRSSLARATASLSTVMRRVITKAVQAGYLEADTSAVVRDGRLVLPVSPMNKRKIPGIVHDESATGKTLFIEPAELVETNNRIRELQIDERREIVRILRDVTDIIRPSTDDILLTVTLLGQLDFIRAKALYAIDIDGRMPNISREPELEWYHAVHPVLLQSLRAHGKSVVPLDITLTKKDRILVISGPNAGGKSVCLKTTGIIQYMTQSGLLPPVYENSHIGIFRDIFIDIGDDQSIDDDLSTYSSHLRAMKTFVARGGGKTMILIDEFGGGTEPIIGGAIAQAILKQLNQKRAWGIVTTHYQNLKDFAEQTPGLINGSMLYDRHLMQPLFKLSIGNPGSSFALEIARKTGLPAAIIADAEEIAGSDYVKLDGYLLDIARDKRYWQNKRENIRLKEKRIDEVLAKYEADAETLRDKRNEILRQAKADALKIIDESNASVERTIREIRTAEAERERTRAARQKLAQQRRDLAADTPEAEHPLLRKAPKPKKAPQTASQPAERHQFTVGEHVKLEGQNTVGTIMEISGKNAMVAFGMLKTSVALDRLRPTDAKPVVSTKTSFVSAATAEASRERQLKFSREIDVRGMRVDEALQAVTYFIDDAIQFGAAEVRILHGTGTGALRQSIREYLMTVPQVVSARDEHVQFGGAGITVVTLA